MRPEAVALPSLATHANPPGNPGSGSLWFFQNTHIFLQQGGVQYKNCSAVFDEATVVVFNLTPNLKAKLVTALVLKTFPPSKSYNPFMLYVQ